MNRVMKLWVLCAAAACLPAPSFAQSFDPAQGILLRGTVVTMDASGTTLKNGNVLVRSGTIVAVWRGRRPPPGTPVGDAVTIDFGPHTLIFPGIINLHNHQTYNMLPLWPAPSSHVQAAAGRPLGTEPYANQYQWGRTSSPPELRRLVSNPNLVMGPGGLGLWAEVVKFSEVKALLGGETADQGSPSDPATNDILIRNVDHENFGRDRIQSLSAAIGIDSLPDTTRTSLLTAMHEGRVDAWLVHLAEGVRDGQRRSGDPISSRSEFATLISKGLLTDMTVIIHGNGLESEDFESMRAAPTIRTDANGNGLGAKLVWSPLSNLLLYGQTALVYHALKAGVLVSLGTDWSPSGSRNLLGELKIADIALRDPRLLGSDRDLIPEFSLTGKSPEDAEAAERALDEQLVRMVTTNPARTLGWEREVGSIQPGKVADLLVINGPTAPSKEGLPNSPYRNLIDATERDVRLVMVDGDPLAGDRWAIESLKGFDLEIVTSPSGGFEKAIDVTKPEAPEGTETFAMLQDSLRLGLEALGGDHPPAGGGTAPNSNTYSYLKAHVPGAAALTNFQFRQLYTPVLGLDPNGRLNIEGIQLPPVLVEDDDFYFRILEGDAFPDNGLIADTSPPFKLYPANFNHFQPGGNPFAAAEYRSRYYDLIGMDPPGFAAGSPTREPVSGSSHADPRVSPSPLTPSGFLTFTTSTPGRVLVGLFDTTGRRVRKLLEDGSLAAGIHQVRIDGTDGQGRSLGAGVYFYRVETPGKAWQGRVVIVR